VSFATLATLLQEISRLTQQAKRLNEDLRDEAREAQHAASSAYSEGRHEGMREARGY
jgi:flagellar biosynthesis/type III secretory pathway protein FliH